MHKVMRIGPNRSRCACKYYEIFTGKDLDTIIRSNSVKVML